MELKPQPEPKPGFNSSDRAMNSVWYPDASFYAKTMMLRVKNVRKPVSIFKEILTSCHFHLKPKNSCWPEAQCQLFSSDRSASSDNPQDESKTPEYRTEPPVHPDRDWIGPVDKRSNLRQIHFAQPPDETVGERQYREMREEIYEWNHAFWAKHNQSFIEAKERFVKEALSRKGVGLIDEDGAKRVLSADEMAEFYREFLQDNQQTLKLYNREWYRRNTALLWPAFKNALQRVFKR